MTDYRREESNRARNAASQKAYDRTHPDHKSNRDEQRYASSNYLMCFTKGLDHDEHTGLVKNAADFEAFRSAIDDGFVEAFTRDVPVPQPADENVKRRQWEAPTAGVVYELQGPDPQAVTMSPAPPLCSDELAFEMAEVYELALVRDVPFNRFDKGGAAPELTAATNRLNDLAYAQNGFKGRPRKTDSDGELDRQTIFRGSSPGVEQGPYLSQFMIIGNASEDSSPDDGYINFGAQRIDQRVLEAREGDDYLTIWSSWHHVQQGFTPNPSPGPLNQALTGNRRFIYTPRDLATYVHVDALYQAYLNACLILLGNGTPFDPGFNILSGMGDGMMNDPASGTRVPLNAGGFALWGGPHILSLVTEVATRGLKAVRYQKFNNHIRLRPEVLAARIEKAEDIEHRYPSICGCLNQMAKDLQDVIESIREHNNALAGEATALLPMAFAEGSPMHPAYGAGHATVAGACVTILKAFFDTSAIFVKIGDNAGFHSKKQIVAALHDGKTVTAGSYQVKKDGDNYFLDYQACGSFELVEEKSSKTKQTEKFAKFIPDGKHEDCCPLTLEGELNKLAANISIGRNMAGVHYFSDYYDSLRMGEEIAIGMLEEQALCYKTDPFVLSLPTFDGDNQRIGKR